jgi:sporulation protein YunB
MYYKIVKTNKKLKKHKRRFIVLFVVLLIVTGIVSLVVYNMTQAKPTIVAYATAQSKAKTTTALNMALFQIYNEGTSYDDLIRIERNTDNEVVLLSADTMKINRLAKNTAVFVQTYLNEITDVDVTIPWGTITGFPILTGVGSEIRLEVDPVSTVLCNFESSFTSAGINQTLHRILIKVDVSLNVIMPTSREVIDIQVPVIVAENLIIGTVPATYLNITQLGSQQTGS